MKLTFRCFALTAAALIAPQLASANAVTWWNKLMTDNTAVGSDPVRETRVFAMTHIAIHDALNTIERRYSSHSYQQSLPGASAEAAVAAAAKHVLVALVPTRAAQVNAAYTQALAAIPDGDAKQRGIYARQTAATAILNRRMGDGSDSPGVQRPGTRPGEYRPTAPDFTPAFLSNWGRVQPFALRNSSQFRPDPPYKLDSREYAMDYAEVASAGEENSAARSEEGSAIAMYWYEASGQGWNRIARNVADARQLGLWESARLFALVNLAMADGFIGGFEAKYHYNFWRPSTAILEGDADGNPDTTGNVSWKNFLPTPPVPDYPSTHSLLGAAAARVLGRFFGTDFISFDMTSGPPYAGITRRFWSFSEAAAENAASRVLAGIHFSAACHAGLAQGNKIGDYVFATQFHPVR